MRPQQGFSLVEILVVLATGTVVVAAMVSGLRYLNQSARKAESNVDRTAIRLRIIEGVSCARTFQAIGGAPGSPCPTGQYVDLRTGSNQIFVPAGGGTIGRWTVRAYCLDSDGSLDVRAAMLSPGAPASALDWRSGSPLSPDHYFRDEVAGTASNSAAVYDWNHPKARVFPAGPGGGGPGGFCAESFSGTPTIECGGANQFVKAFDRSSGSAVCGNIPTCGAEAALRWDATSGFTCTGNARSDASIASIASSAAAAQVAAKTAPSIAIAFGNLTATAFMCSSPAAVLHQGTATCPPGHRVIAGSVNCSVFPGGPMSNSRRESDTSWYGSCCIAVPVFGPNAIQAICMPL